MVRGAGMSCQLRYASRASRVNGKRPNGPIQRLELARPHEGAVTDGVKERLLAQPVARKQRLATVEIDRAECKHAAQPSHDVGPHVT